jgi:hypothetical protein
LSGFVVILNYVNKEISSIPNLWLSEDFLENCVSSVACKACEEVAPIGAAFSETAMLAFIFSLKAEVSAVCEAYEETGEKYFSPVFCRFLRIKRP